MEPIQARILRGDEVVQEKIDVWLNVIQDGSMKSWEGHFDLTELGPELLGETFRIVLADGRTGEFVITNMSTDSKSMETGVDFRGKGPLE